MKRKTNREARALYRELRERREADTAALLAPKAYHPGALFRVSGDDIDTHYWIGTSAAEAVAGVHGYQRFMLDDPPPASELSAAVAVSDPDEAIDYIDEESGDSVTTTLRRHFDAGGACGYFSSVEA
jgi:hypothetical protein